MQIGVLALLSYLIGSLPTGYLAVRWRTGRDLRQLGDGNVGAENVARALGARAGVVVGGVDIAKGAGAVLLAQLWLDATPALLVAGTAAVAGHSWPVFLGGHGGRGAATALGALLAVLPYPGLPLALLALAVVYFTRSATTALASFFILTPLVAVLTSWVLPDDWPGRWPFHYSYPEIGYALALPVLVGVIHFLSLRRRPGP